MLQELMIFCSNHIWILLAIVCRKGGGGRYREFSANSLKGVGPYSRFFHAKTMLFSLNKEGYSFFRAVEL
jgi:hypothetical protein